jgi:hypothetical protein
MTGILGSLIFGLTITEHHDWLIFVERLAEAVRTGRVRKVPVLKPVWGGSTEEWFLDPETGEVYFYVPPDPPGMPKWERIDVLKHMETPDPPPLSVFNVGQISVMTAHVMKMSLEALVGRGLAAELPVPAEVPQPKDGTEKWYKDTVSNVVYRLIEHYPLEGAGDIRWEVVPQTLLQGLIQ